MIRHEKLVLARRCAALIVALPLVGCVVGPDYQRPSVAPPASFRGQTAAHAGPRSFADLPWADVFQDPTLRDLIARGLENNQDLQIAAARIERARALVGVTRSQGRPQLNYGLQAGVENAFTPDRDNLDTLTVGSLRGALDAAWEFDVWGRIRRSTEAARANLMAEEDIRRGVMLTLVADTASGYFRLLELDREKAIAEENARIYSRTLDLFTRRFEAGRDNRLPMDRAQALYDSSTAQLADLQGLIAQQENALNVLIGSYPGPIVRGAPLLGQSVRPTPVGATSALLQRRPDILAAEQRMIEANATIGVAIAEKFPRIGLSTLLGGLNANVEGNWSGLGVWNVALSAAGPILSGGRLESIEQERRARLQETIAEYRKTVLIAFKETSDALAAQNASVKLRLALESQVAALRRSSDLALARYDAGRASYFEVLEAQQQLLPAENALARAQRDELLIVVDLYKALGGGWSGSEISAAPPDQLIGARQAPGRS